MNSQSKDILELIPYEKLPELRDLFKKNWPSTVYTYNFINVFIKLKKERPTENYVDFYCPNGDFSDGTFVAIIKMRCYDLFVYTLEKSLQRLRTALTETKIIDWEKKPVFAAVQQEYFNIISEVLNEKKCPVIKDYPNHVWWLPKDSALQFSYSIPPELYVGELNESHIELMNSEWPHRHPGSEKYIAKMVKLNGGIGLFLKSSGELVCWITKNYFGGLGILQTVQEHKRKGYATLIIKIFSKILAEKDGCDIALTVIKENIPSQKVFSSLNFKTVNDVTWCLCWKL